MSMDDNAMMTEVMRQSFEENPILWKRIRNLEKERGELQAKLDNVIDELKLVKEQISKGADPTPLETYRFVSDLLKEMEK